MAILGIGGASALALQPEASETKADESSLTSKAFWKRVRSTSELTEGSTVIIVSNENYVLNGCGVTGGTISHYGAYQRENIATFDPIDECTISLVRSISRP